MSFGTLMEALGGRLRIPRGLLCANSVSSLHRDYSQDLAQALPGILWQMIQQGDSVCPSSLLRLPFCSRPSVSLCYICCFVRHTVMCLHYVAKNNIAFLHLILANRMIMSSGPSCFHFPSARMTTAHHCARCWELNPGLGGG